MTDFLNDDTYSASWLALALSDVCDEIEGLGLADEGIADLVANLADELRARGRNMPASRDESLGKVCHAIESWGVNGLQMPDLILSIIPELADRRDGDAPTGIYFQSDAAWLEGRA